MEESFLVGVERNDEMRRTVERWDREVDDVL